MTISSSTTVFCDDIRREDNGKIIIIGYYTNTINFISFPAQVNLAALVLLKTDLQDTGKKFSLIIRLRSGTVLYKHDAVIVEPPPHQFPDSDGLVTLFVEVRSVVVNVAQQDYLSVEMDIEGQELLRCGEVAITAINEVEVG